MVGIRRASGSAARAGLPSGTTATANGLQSAAAQVYQYGGSAGDSTGTGTSRDGVASSLVNAATGTTHGGLLYLSETAQGGGGGGTDMGTSGKGGRGQCQPDAER